MAISSKNNSDYGNCGDCPVFGILFINYGGGRYEGEKYKNIIWINPV